MVFGEQGVCTSQDHNLRTRAAQHAPALDLQTERPHPLPPNPSQYAECNADRSRVFERLESAYPTVVALPQGSACAPSLFVTAPSSSRSETQESGSKFGCSPTTLLLPPHRPILSLSWHIQVGRGGRVHSTLGLEAAALDVGESHNKTRTPSPSALH